MDYLVIFLSFIILLILPGFLLYNLLVDEDGDNIILKLPLYFTVSLIILIPIGLLAYQFNFTWFLTNLLLFIFIALLLFLNIKNKKFKFKSLDLDGVSMAVIFLMISTSVFMFFIPQAIDFTDAPFHVGQIRKLVENDPITPFEAFISTNKVIPQYGYDIWYLALGLLSRFARLDILLLWENISFLLVPLFISSAYLLGTKLFRDKRAGFVYLFILLIVLIFLKNALDFRVAAYPRIITQFIILPSSLAFFFSYIRYQKNIYLFLAILTGFLITTIHLYAWVQLLLTLFGFGLLSMILKNKEYYTASFKVLIGVILLSLPYLALKFQDLGSTFLPIDPTYSRDTLMVAIRFFKNSLISGALVILVALIIKYKTDIKKNTWLIYLTSAAFVFIVIYFIPPIYSLSVKVISQSYAVRLRALFPLELIWSSFIFFFIFKESFSKKILGKIFVIVLTVFLVGGLYFLPFSNYNESNSGALSGKFNTPSRPNIKILNYIKNELSSGKVFAADYRLSYWIPASSYNYIVMTYPDHTTQTVNRGERIEDLDLILNENSDVGETVKKLNKYQVNYIAIIKTRIEEIDETKFGKNSQYFREIYEDETYILFEVRYTDTLD